MNVVPIVDMQARATQISGQDVQKGVVAVLATQMGGRDITRKCSPTVRVC